MNYTTIEQSKKLLELGLSLETADMYYTMLTENSKEPSVFVKRKVCRYNVEDGDIPCWSLGALMELMPKICEDENDGGCYPTLCKGFDTDMWHCVYRSTLHITDWYKSSINAAFEMVVWLLKNNYIN